MPKEHLDYALEYAARGWPVFPLQPKEKKPLSGTHGFKDASVNEIILTRLWDREPAANIGLATGKDAGLWVLDIDGPAGSKSLTDLENEIGPLPETLEQKTGGGGRQLFFKWPERREIRNKQSLRPGIDIRGEGGYVVLPPSIHPSGTPYEWSCKQDKPIVDVPGEWLDVVVPPKKNVAPWERVSESPGQAAAADPAPIGGTPIIERAALYLRECDSAVEGAGGHNDLLWASRALVIGFDLNDATALSLLWSDFNPRCSPPWDQAKPKDRKDFERKVQEARNTPGVKPKGWLLDELGLRSGEDMAKDIAVGLESRDNLLASIPDILGIEANPGSACEVERQPFPVEYFPSRLADYCRQISEAHVVDLSFAALPVLAVAGAAMGNPWRLQLKRGFVVSPNIWVGIVAASGTNKSGPLHEIVAPLQTVLSVEDIKEDPMLCPTGRMIVSDATIEAVISQLVVQHRGLLMFRDELAGWAKSFNAYRKSGGDEQAWIEFWGAKAYYLDRKTDNEQVVIHAASMSVLGGIQPHVLVECFDPGKFASGLVPRLLITCPPPTDMYWSEIEVGKDATEEWNDAIMWLRTRPFASLETNSGRFLPYTLKLSSKAKEVYVGYFNSVSQQIGKLQSESAISFASKARVLAGRLMLIHHGLSLASKPAKDKAVGVPDAPVGPKSAEAGVAWAAWCLAEQLRVYGFSRLEYNKEQATRLAALIKDKSANGLTATVRQVQRYNSRRYKNGKEATAAMDQLVEAGLAHWDSKKEKVTLI